jgi:hypothetical protein
MKRRRGLSVRMIAMLLIGMIILSGITPIFAITIGCMYGVLHQITLAADACFNGERRKDLLEWATQMIAVLVAIVMQREPPDPPDRPGADV